MFKHLAKDFLYEYAKGGGGAMPVQQDPMATANAQMALQNNQASIDSANAARAKADADAKHAADVTASQGRVSSAYNNAVNYGSQQLGAKHLDASSGYGQQLSNLYRSALDSARSSAPDVVSDASSLFGPSLYDTAYNTVRGTARQDLNNQLNQFIGTGFETQAFGDNADDDIINSIVGTQKTDSQRAIDAARARGQLNDVGYNRAETELGTANSAAISKANSLGLGVLSGYRKDLTDFASNQHKAVDNYDLGDTYDPNAAHSTLDSMISQRKNSMNGDILAAIGGQRFFDTDSILGLGTGASGVQNNSGASNVTSGLGGASSALTGAYNTGTGSNTDGSNKSNQAF